MTNTKHTPAPWKTGTTNQGIRYVGAEYKDENGMDFEGHIASVPCEENALLIAASPELYNGCNALLGLLELWAKRGDLPKQLYNDIIGNHRVKEARAAVAKAKGKYNV